MECQFLIFPNHTNCSSKENTEKIVDTLLSKGAEIDATNSHERTPLMNAVMNGNEILVDVLLSKGANTSAVDSAGNTALIYAANVGSEVCYNLIKSRSEGQADIADYQDAIQRAKGETDLEEMFADY
ncbi:hypothetical protein ACOME3_004123 [Neoechinorhynchus agilis]